jgi:hypothetical protein
MDEESYLYVGEENFPIEFGITHILQDVNSVK